MIVALSKEGDTVKEIRDKIHYDVEAKKVLDEYIRRGFGDWIAKDHFR